MKAQCTVHIQLKSLYGVSRVMCHREPGPTISMSKVRGPGVEVKHVHHISGSKVILKMPSLQERRTSAVVCN